jgi:SAM-dependent methyltransferase
VSAIARLLPPAPADVLDVACGTGFVSIIAARLGYRVTGVDLSQPMLDEASKAASDAGLQIDFDINDAVAPAFPKGSFHAITNRHFLWTLREPLEALRNWHALLRPGGRVVSIDGFWFRDQPPPAEGDFVGRYYTAQVRAALPVMSLSDPAAVAQLFRDAGFADVDVSDLADVHALAEDPPSADPWYVIVATRD